MFDQKSFVFAIVVVAAILFASNKIRYDVVALLVVLTLMISNILTPAEAASGFGDPMVPLVAGLLVVGEMLSRTGVIYAISDSILHYGGKHETRLMGLIMLAAAGLSSLMSSTAVVAIFIPVVLQISRESGISRRRLLMPLGFFGLIGGMLTLIATTPNLIASASLASAGYEPLSFFAFTPIGAAVLVAAMIYLLTIGLRGFGTQPSEQDQPDGRRSMAEMIEAYRVEVNYDWLSVSPHSTLTGHSLSDERIETRYGVRVIAVDRHRGHRNPWQARAGSGRRALLFSTSEISIQAEDGLLVIGPPEAIAQFMETYRLQRRPMSAADQAWVSQELGVAEVLVHPESRMVGETMSDAEIGSRYHVQVLGIRRGRQPLDEHLDEIRLEVSDTLLVAGPWERIRELRRARRDLLLLEMPSEISRFAPARSQAALALAIVGLMVVLSMFQIVPILAAVMIAALLAIASRCLTMEEAYRAINWSSLVLLAGMIPLAVAMEKTGGLELLVNWLVNQFGDYGPTVLLTVIFWLTATLGLFLSNTATSVVMAPIAIQSAEALDVSPYPFAMMMAIGASAGFPSPVSSPVVTLIVEPGEYEFMDFFRLGMPLQLLTYIVAILIIPLLFPL